MPGRSVLLEWDSIRRFFPTKSAWSFPSTCQSTLHYSQCLQHKSIERGTETRNFSPCRNLLLSQTVTLCQFTYPDGVRWLGPLNRILAAPNTCLALLNVTTNCTIEKTCFFGLYVATVVACNFYKSNDCVIICALLTVACFFIGQLVL
jgi:hypothetical protein